MNCSADVDDGSGEGNRATIFATESTRNNAGAATLMAKLRNLATDRFVGNT